MRCPVIFSKMGQRNLVVVLPALLTGFVGLALWLGACAPNDPFDPLSVENKPPVMRMSIEPVDPGQELRPTSYYERRFTWYGSDQDGWVQEYYVSIRTEAAVPAPWVTTTRTDTTMSFVTDENGDAQATFYLVCQDDRGALSDTLVKYIPLRNSPPAVGFQSDYEPLRNMQREITNPGTAAADTSFWNWGPTYFRFFALDPDGAATMDTFYQYTFAVPDPTESYDQDDPQADPLTTWVRVPYGSQEEIKEFELFVTGVEPGSATLTVIVTDEAGAVDREVFQWEVRAPRSNIMYVPDNTSTAGKELYYGLMDDRFGADNWDFYDFWFGFPEHPFVLLETFRLFDAVIWTDGGGTSDNLTRAAGRGGVLESYVSPTDGTTPGKLLQVSRVLTGGTSGLPPAYIQNVLGISPSGEPAPTLNLPAGKQAQPEIVPGLPVITSASPLAKGIGLKPLDDSVTESTDLGPTESLYRMEYCRGCYNNRPPYDPIMAIRRPVRTVSALAQVVGISMQLEYFDRAEALAALVEVLDTEMGVPTP